MENSRSGGEFHDLQAVCQDLGASLKDCGNGHWQVRGGPFAKPINYYPGTRKVYLSGAVRGYFVRDICDEIESLAEGQKPKGGSRVRRMKSSEARKVRGNLWFRGTRCCHWCNKRFESEDSATIDHVVPLSKGGSNRQDNLVLACEECNAERADSLAAGDFVGLGFRAAWISRLNVNFCLFFSGDAL